MQKSINFRSLIFKIGAPSTLVCVVVFSVIAIFFRYENIEFIRKKIDNEIYYIENTLNIALEGNSSIGNFRRVVNALGSGKAIERLVLIEEDSGIILADTQNQRVGEYYTDVFSKNELQTVHDHLISKTRNILSSEDREFVADRVNLISPKINRLRPFLVLVIYDKTVDLEMANRNLSNIIIVLSLGLLSLLFLAFLVQHYVLLKPLGKIIRTIKKQAESGEVLTINVDSKDELGILAKHYDRMSTQKILKDATLHKLSLRMEVAIDATKLGVFEYDVHTNTHIWNSRMYQILGLDENKFTPDSTSWYLGVHPEDQEIVKEKLFGALKTGLSFSHEYRLLKDSNIVTTVRTYVQTVSDDHGKTIHIIGTLLDITSQTLLSEQREDALIKAEESGRLKSEFLASVSHEIRTPMNGVIGMIELLSKSSLNQKQVQYTNLAKNSAESLLHLINDILDFSKIDAGKMDIDTIEFNILESLGDCVDSLAVKSQEKGIELILDTSAVTHHNLLGDPGRLRQIVVNLVANAIKFTESGAVIVSAETNETKQGEVELCCKVVDSGIGISSNKISTLFESFTQVDASTTKKYGGTGLGLAIVQKLCELMKGSVSITSTVDVGTCVTFNIFLSIDKTIIDEDAKINFDNKQILIVEGNAECRKVLCKQLSPWNARVDSVANGKGALAALYDTNYSLIFISNNFADMSVFKLAEQIRHLESYQNATLVLLCNIADSHILEDSSNLDFNFSLSKPLTYTRLLEAFGTQNLKQGKNSSSPVIQTIEHSNEPACRILLVEDNFVNQKVIVGLLEDFNVDIEIANDGLEALALLSNTTDYFEIILMDCQMPKLDGFETTQCIRSGDLDKNGQHYKSIPIVAVTANAIVGEKERCLDAGMNEYLTKPINFDQLARALQRYLPNLSKKPETNELIELLNMNLNPREQEQNSEVWDRELVLRRVRGKEDRLHMLIDLFLASTPPLIEEAADQACQASNSELAKTAHTIKGSAGNISGMQLFETANKLEFAALSNTQADIDGLVLDLSEQYQVLAGVLKNEAYQNSPNS